MGFSYLFGINYSLRECISRENLLAIEHAAKHEHEHETQSLDVGFDLYMSMRRGTQNEKTRQITYAMNIADGFFSVPRTIECHLLCRAHYCVYVRCTTKAH